MEWTALIKKTLISASSGLLFSVVYLMFIVYVFLPVYTFITSLVTNVDSFLSKYNYKVFGFYVLDNWLPLSALPVVDLISALFYSTALFLACPFSMAYMAYVEFFCFVENSVTHGANFIVSKAVSIALKFLLCICLLIFARGGIPRFRFDYLTRLGWIRFLSLVLMSFLIELFLLSML